MPKPWTNPNYSKPYLQMPKTTHLDLRKPGFWDSMPGRVCGALIAGAVIYLALCGLVLLLGLLMVGVLGK